MQILLANAKIMFERADKVPLSTPLFQPVANQLAAEMACMDIDQLARQLDCSRKLAAENWMRYQHFHSATTMPALLAYNGQAYKHLKAKTLSDEELIFAQRHLWITCFLYGLLRPMDGIVPYRMEHCVCLDTTGGKPIHQFWKDKLTDTLIQSVKADDGISPLHQECGSSHSAIVCRYMLPYLAALYTAAWHIPIRNVPDNTLLPAFPVWHSPR